MADWDNSRFTYAKVLQGGTGVYYKKDDKLRYAVGVESMQKKLNKIGYNCGTPDGKFGDNTDRQVKSFQSNNALTSDGCAGKNTLTILDSLTSGTTPIDPPTTPSNMNTTKVSKLIDYCRSATGTMQTRWGYVWGASGQVYTESVANELYNAHHTDDYDMNYYTVTQIRLWKNHRVCDCSGLLKSYLKDNKITLEDSVSYYNANKFYQDECDTKGTLSSSQYGSLAKGTLVFDHSSKTNKKVHVGVCTGNGMVIHSSGSETGVVEEALSSRFDYYGIAKFLC